MRQYYPIWSQLKRDKQVSITCNRKHHPRIIKAVCKEKWMDIAHKIILDMEAEPKIGVLNHVSKGAILTFNLDIRDKKLCARDLGFSYLDLHSNDREDKE